jgi:CheY-like chemotaxis protein
VNTKSREILVVDDDPVIRDMMIDILSFEGFSIQVVRNGREALTTLRGPTNFLVFLDLLMPVMSGRELCQHLNADPLLRNRHIIVIMSALENLGEAAALKADATMSKPFSVDDIIRVIEPFVA